MRGTPPPEAVAATPAPEEGEGLVVSRRRKEEEEVVVVSFRLLSAFFFRGRGAALATQKLSKEPILLIFRFNDTAKVTACSTGEEYRRSNRAKERASSREALSRVNRGGHTESTDQQKKKKTNHPLRAASRHSFSRERGAAAALVARALACCISLESVRDARKDCGPRPKKQREERQKMTRRRKRAERVKHNFDAGGEEPKRSVFF